MSYLENVLIAAVIVLGIGCVLNGFCAYCRAYRAGWLTDCTNPIHTTPRKELEILEPPATPPTNERETA